MKNYLNKLARIFISFTKGFTISGLHIFGAFTRWKRPPFTFMYHPSNRKYLDKPAYNVIPNVDKESGKVTFPKDKPAIEQHTVAKRDRGIHALTIEDCILCMSCAKACPIACITILGEKIGKGKGAKYCFERFTIDYSKCMFCGLCVEVCPKSCLVHTPEWDYSSFFRDNLVKNMLTNLPYKKPEPIESTI
ncbi:MAG: 4Fe-4S binding protein [Candidatus Heimdallarchaeota archaeon]|nr:4Fe-4S binding protein [Candidatus Heimdallarchaeota archaeon]